MNRQAQYIVGVDEAGRGPLAGPVVVGVVSIPKGFNWRLIKGVTDSKKLSHENREAIFVRARELEKEGLLEYKVAMIGSATIDRIGITKAVQLGINRSLRRLPKYTGRTCVKLDGLLKAPSEFKNQKTIIKGDQKEKVIGLASIMAKVTRDRYMVRMSKKYPEYGFEQHKGYGTKSHTHAIKGNGLSDLHRTSFCRNALS